MWILATFVHLMFTVPASSAPLESLAVIAKDRLGFQWRPTLYSAPLPNAPAPVPGVPGTTQHLYLSQSQDGSPRRYMALVRNRIGWSAEGNWVWVVALLPTAETADSLWTLDSGSVWKMPAGGVVGFRLPPGFPAWATRPVPQEWIQLRDRALICRLHHLWSLRGVTVPCN